MRVNGAKPLKAPHTLFASLLAKLVCYLRQWAGAGVVGLAVGFGAQKLVQDVITGTFLLFEDAVNVGDVIKVNGTVGTVEVLTIRAIWLRDEEGTLHTIPFGSVSRR